MLFPFLSLLSVYLLSDDFEIWKSLSTSKEVRTLPGIAKLKAIPQIMSIITSKTGKFIKPASTFNSVLNNQGDENEVLFKPGVQFKVTERYDATNKDSANGPYVFPGTMPSSYVTLLQQDPEKATIKYILVKQEV